MRAVWYDRQGAAEEVLQVGEMPAQEPGPEEVRVRITLSGANPGDTKKRRGWLGSEMPFPRVIPHSDGAGVIESVGSGSTPSGSGTGLGLRGSVLPALRHGGGADHRSRATGHAPDGVDRIVEVAFSDNIDLDAAVSRNQTVITAYASRDDRPSFPFWPMLFDNLTIRLLGSDDFPADAKLQAATDLTAAARDGALAVAVEATMPLEATAQAHDLVDAGRRGRVLIAVPA